MRIEASSVAPEGWDRYVASHSLGTSYHSAAATGIGRRAFGLRTTYLAAIGESDQILGLLPLVEQSSLLFGRFLVSLPFVTYGGILADEPAVAAALVARAAAEARARHAHHLELRDTVPIGGAGLVERLDKVSMVLSLPTSEQALARQLGSKLRSQIKRGEREQLELVWGGAELLDEFYHVFAPAMHALGTPVYARSFFTVAFEALADVAAVLSVRMRGSVHGAAILVRHGRSVEVPWAVASEEAKHLSVNMRMYWELLRRAVALGAEEFDFGRSTIESGTYRFKRQWGAQPRQLHWHYWLPRDAPAPKLNQSNPKYARAAALWRRMPLWCANLIGPSIARKLP
jgi:serine/alanine adding enzyme